MPTLNINGHNVDVDEDFLKLSPEDQHAAVDHISRSLPPKQAMREEPGRYPRPAPSAPAGPKEPERSGAEDLLKSAPRGALEGLMDFISSQGQSEANLTQPPELAKQVPGPEESTRIAEQYTGELPKPQGGAGQYGATIGRFFGNPLSYIGPGGLAAKGASALGGAVGSEAAGQLAQGSPWEGAARLAGALFGGAAGPRAVTPVPRNMPPATAASHARDVKLLQQEGIPLTAADTTGSERLGYVENTLRGGTDTAQREAFTRAATRRAGMPVSVIDHGSGGTVDTMLQNNAQQFQRAAQNDFHLDHQLQADLGNTFDTYTGTPGLYGRRTEEAIKGSITRIADVLQTNGGMMSGAQYQTLRSDLNRAARTSADPQHAGALFDIIGNLDDAMERSIRHAGGNPQEFQQARDQYRAILTIEKAAAAQGAEAAQGHISPARLSMAARTVYGGRAYETGKDPFSELARAGQSVMKRLPDSGTSQRNRINLAVRTAGGLAGGLVGFHHGGFGAEPIAGLLAGERAGELIGEPIVRAVGRNTIMSKPGQRYLQNQLIPQATSQEALIRALRGGAVEQQSR